MDERTDTTARHHRTRFELIFASVLLAIGLFILPAAIFWFGVTLLGTYGEAPGAGMGTFYGDFYGDLAQGEVRTWSLALAPLILISIVRAIFLGTRPKPVADDVAEIPAAVPHNTADSRRVEPRIGSD